MAASTLSCSSLNPSTTTFSRTKFSVPASREFFPLDFSPFGSRTSKRTRKLVRVTATVADAPRATSPSTQTLTGKDGTRIPQKKIRILVAGGGIGGLVFALAAKKKGFEVLVFEKDLSAIRGEGQYRGPIQIQSNALAALEAIDSEVAEEVMRVGCITGDRINGLVDGVSGSW